MKGFINLRELNLKDKNVFLRVDFNCPIKNSEVADNTRIKAALPTIEYILEQKGKLVIGSHLGRPKGKFNSDFSLQPVAEELHKLTGYEVLMMDDPMSDAPKAILHQLKSNQVILLENLRFSPDERGKTGKLSRHWQAFTQVYVNDAFGVCHRSDTSVYDFPLSIPDRAPGFLIEKEINFLNKVKENPEKPLAVIMGGAKVSDKVPMIEKLLDQTDIFVIGGAMAFTFLSAQGKPVGNSLVEEDLIPFCKDLMMRMETRGKKILLPFDFVQAKEIDASSGQNVDRVGAGFCGFDIGPKTSVMFVEELKKAKTILWNGPMGVFENEAFAAGTRNLCNGLSKMDSLRIVGGGDTAAAAKLFEGDFDHISTGGGASLSFLEGSELPGLKALRPTRKEILEKSRYVLDPIDPKEFEESEGE